jgi:urease accessory protein
MRRAVAVAAAGTWPAEAAVAGVTLGYDDRHRRRIVLTADDGAPVLLDLDRAAVLAEGCGLALDGGGWIAVHAAAEPVIEARGRDPAATARLAWHLGNRHAPVQVLPDGTLRLRDDPVLAAMLEGLGAEVCRRLAPFTPEPGAYAGGHHGRHDDGC